MATWDNKDLLVNYIRHCFITCDDTGVCEAVLEPPEVSEKPGAIKVQAKDNSNRVDDDYDVDSGHELSHSPDIHVDVGHRRRSETSKRLETLKQQRSAQSKIVTVRWKSFDNEKSNAENWANLFEEKEIVKRKTPLKSAVSEKLKACAAQPANSFSDYAKFDANVSLGTSGRCVRVFLTMVQDLALRQNPLEVNVINTAKVSDLIGLICYHYSNLNYSPVLQTDVSKYALYVAEDNGEIDTDLPPRSPSENVSRFHFPFLALVERNSFGMEVSVSSKKYQVSVRTAAGQTYKFEVDSLDTTLQTVRDLTLEKRNKGPSVHSHQIMDYNLEKVVEPGVTLSLDSTLHSVGVFDFCLVRANSSRVENSQLARTGPETSVKSPLSPVCHFYTVTMMQKFKRELPVQLSVSSDHIEIAPIVERKSTAAGRLLNTLQRSASLKAAKSVSLPLERLGGVEMLETKSGGKKLFRIVHRTASGDWKSHMFEGDTNVVDEIIYHLDMYMDLRNSDVRSEFLQRTPRKTSIFKRLQFSDLAVNDSGSSAN